MPFKINYLNGGPDETRKRPPLSLSPRAYINQSLRICRSPESDTNSIPLPKTLPRNQSQSKAIHQREYQRENECLFIQAGYI